jgi:subtilisin
MSRPAAAALLCLLIGAAMLPGSAAWAEDAPRRTYIVSLDVPDAGKALRPANRQARQRIRDRALDTRQATDRIVRSTGLRPRHRFTSAISGFSARLTRQEAASLGRDRQVASVRPARRVRPTAQTVPAGIRRVNAQPGGSPSPDVDVDIAIIDTGIGPVEAGLGPAARELNVAGGINCFDNGPADDYEDADTGFWHGTHVAGIAAARDNDKGVVGVAPGARLWAVRVFDSGGGDEATVLCGLEWAIETRLGGLPADQTIDVINMSLEAQRLPFSEECGNPNDPDPMHRAVCAATAAGITVVVAAGNAGGYSTNRRASTVVPAAYDQVITVAAMNDYDGQGGGSGSSSCSGGGDDRFAWYSNYGPDVDIVAPGTCVRSTAVSSVGVNTHRLSGTSQATPHVTGAVARYLAEHPGTSPTRMRQLVRAAGRLDWFPSSDPGWSGVSDRDPPNRVLDMAALEGDADLRVWLSRARVPVGRGDGTTHRLRVDVQRIGGWDGEVDLGLSGLPGAVGTAAFDLGGPRLEGIDDLGARLTLRLKRDGPQGRRELEVTAQGSSASPSASRALVLIVDRNGPVVSELGARIRGGNVALSGRHGAASVLVHWKVTDKHSAVKSALLQRRVGRQAWRSIAGKLTSARVTLSPGQSNAFRVRARDGLGNQRTSPATSARLVLRDSDSSAWRVPADGWRRRGARGAQGGSLLAAQGTTPSLSTSFTGKAVAVVAPVGPERGKLRLRIDGGAWRVVDLRRPRSQQRRIVFSRELARGVHTLEIQGLSRKTSVDAILFVR